MRRAAQSSAKTGAARARNYHRMIHAVDPFEAPAADPTGADASLDGDVEVALLDYDQRRRRFRVLSAMVAIFFACILIAPYYLLAQDYFFATRGWHFVKGTALLAVILSAV